MSFSKLKSPELDKEDISHSNLVFEYKKISTHRIIINKHRSKNNNIINSFIINASRKNNECPVRWRGRRHCVCVI